MIFKIFQIVVDGTKTTEENIKEIVNSKIKTFNYKHNVYLVEKELLNDDLIWMYIQYENPNLYGDIVFDTFSNVKTKNNRKKTQVEIRKQFFTVIDLKQGMLYINEYNKKTFLSSYISHILEQEVFVKNVYSSLSEFQSSVKFINSVKFVQKRNTMNVMDNKSIFEQQANELGFDAPQSITMQIDCGKSPIGMVKNALQNIKNKRESGYFEDVVVIGKDDDDIEQRFDFKALIKNIDVPVMKNENERFDENQVKELIINKIRSLNV